MRISEEEERMINAIRDHYGWQGRSAALRYVIRDKYREITAPAARPRKAAPPAEDTGWE